MWVYLLLSTLLIYLYWFYFTKVRRISTDAPGPLPLPIIGNIHHIVKGDPIIFRSFHKLQLKYGPVVKFWLGSKQAALISGTEELKEMMHNPAFDNRRLPNARKQLIYEIYTGQTVEENPDILGILFASGENWKNMRRFAIRSLRDHGFGKQTAETFILEEAQYLVDYLKNQIEKNSVNVIHNFDEIFTMMALNIVWQIAAGERFNFDENGMVQLLHFMQAINETFWSIAFKSPLNSIPILKHFPPWIDVINQANSKMESLRSFYKDTIQKHRQSLGGI